MELNINKSISEIKFSGMLLLVWLSMENKTPIIKGHFDV
jgi:hypothetical protein